MAQQICMYIFAYRTSEKEWNQPLQLQVGTVTTCLTIRTADYLLYLVYPCLFVLFIILVITYVGHM